VAVEAQGLVSYGAAAATGSTAGTAAGAKLNKALDDVLGKTGKAAERAAKQGAPEAKSPAKPKTKPAELIHVSVAPVDSTRPAGAPSTTATPRPYVVAGEVSPLTEIPAAVVAPPPIVATAETLATIQSGAKRDDLGKLGEPAYKMSVPEDGHLVEVYRYRAEGKDLGTVRLTDGVVTSVQAFPR
jgi:hypothetical protein